MCMSNGLYIYICRCTDMYIYICIYTYTYIPEGPVGVPLWNEGSNTIKGMVLGT